MKRLFVYIMLCLSVVACSSDKGGSSDDPFKEGVHYRTLEEPIDLGTSKIILTEFFWYGCPHCASFDPLINHWETNKPKGVFLKKAPAVWSEVMKLHGKVYFMAYDFDQTGALHTRLFQEIINLRSNQDPQAHYERLAAVFAEHGVSRETFDAQVNSFAVEGQLEKSMDMMRKAGVKGTPTLMVNGKYIVLNDNITRAEDLLDIADFLIQKELDAKAGQAAQ